MKLFSRILILLLVFSLVLTGCNVNTSEQDTTQSITEVETPTDENGDKTTLPDDGSQKTEDSDPPTSDAESTTDEGETSKDDSETTTDGDETTTDEDTSSTDEGEITTDEGETTTDEGETTTDEGETTTEEESTTVDPESIIDPSPEPDTEISIKSAIALGLTYSSNKFTSDKFYVRGKVINITASGTTNITIQNSYGDTLLLYRVKDEDGGSYTSMANKPSIGDTILVYGIIGQYQGTPEMKDGWIVLVESIGGGNGDGTTPSSDPYANMSAAEFYANYKPATSWEDAYWRSKHYFMSGEIADQYQAPTVSPFQPKSNGLFEKNYSMLYSDDGNTYYVLDAYGNVAFEIYRGGAYIMLEEVAAYVFAFGDVPANYDPNKKASPSSSPWGKYLRVNKTNFTGDTGKYPYEPALPDITGCGGNTYYYEIDIGTMGTDCDPSYPPRIYNNGSSIDRGAARIVFGRRDLNGNGTYEAGEVYVFYTFNHYNDFQEYLNYEGGWGQIFGNITGGGVISSKYDYNPTPYVKVTAAYFATSTARAPHYSSISIYYIDTRSLYFASRMCA